MTDLDLLIADAEAYAKKAGLSIATISRKLFGDGTRIGKMKSGEASALSRTIKTARIRLSQMEASRESA